MRMTEYCIHVAQFSTLSCSCSVEHEVTFNPGRGCKSLTDVRVWAVKFAGPGLLFSPAPLTSANPLTWWTALTQELKVFRASADLPFAAVLITSHGLNWAITFLLSSDSWLKMCSVVFLGTCFGDWYLKQIWKTEFVPFKQVIWLCLSFNLDSFLISGSSFMLGFSFILSVAHLFHLTLWFFQLQILI